MSNCQANHDTHLSMSAKTVLGEIRVFYYPKYMGFNGYCTGQDEVSKSLDVNGTWDMEIFNRMKTILQEKSDNKKLFVDIGSHIGWFSRLALLEGCDVECYEGDSDNIILSKMNAANALHHFVWFDEGVEPTGLKQDIYLMKIDIEGKEEHAIKYFENSIKARKVKNIIMEVSPIFNGSYPALVNKLQNYGYEVLRLNGEKWNGKFDFDQTDLWFRLA